MLMWGLTTTSGDFQDEATELALGWGSLLNSVLTSLHLPESDTVKALPLEERAARTLALMRICIEWWIPTTTVLILLDDWEHFDQMSQTLAMDLFKCTGVLKKTPQKEKRRHNMILGLLNIASPVTLRILRGGNSCLFVVVSAHECDKLLFVCCAVHTKTEVSWERLLVTPSRANLCFVLSCKPFNNLLTELNEGSLQHAARRRGRPPAGAGPSRGPCLLVLFSCVVTLVSGAPLLLCLFTRRCLSLSLSSGHHYPASAGTG